MQNRWKAEILIFDRISCRYGLELVQI